MKKDKKRAEKILKTVSKSIVNPPLTSEGYLDVSEFNALPVIKAAIEELRLAGYQNSADLSKAGFVAAGLVFKFGKEA